MGKVIRIFRNRMSASKWWFAFAAWIGTYIVFVGVAYFDEKAKLEADIHQRFHDQVPSDISFSDILSLSDFPFAGLFGLLFLMVFVPATLNAILHDKLKEEMHVGWRRIYFTIPTLAVLLDAYESMLGKFSSHGYWDLLITVFLAALVGFIISSVIMWIRSGFVQNTEAKRKHDNQLSSTNTTATGKSDSLPEIQSDKDQATSTLAPMLALSVVVLVVFGVIFATHKSERDNSAEGVGPVPAAAPVPAPAAAPTAPSTSLAPNESFHDMVHPAPRAFVSYNGLHEVDIEKYRLTDQNLPQKFADGCPDIGDNYATYSFQQNGQQLLLIEVDTGGANFQSSHYELSSRADQCKLVASVAKDQPSFESQNYVPKENYSLSVPILDDKNELRYLLLEEKRYPGKYSDAMSERPLEVKTYSFARALFAVSRNGFKLINGIEKKGIRVNASVEAVIPMSTLLQNQ